MRHHSKTCFGVAAIILPVVLTLTLRAQEQNSPDRPAQLRAEVRMILVPVTVVDRRGVAVNGLGQANFVVLDDKVPQNIVSFSSEDTPCSIGLVLDLSGSMRDRLKSAKEALTEFLVTANPEDEFSLFGVTTEPLVYAVGSVNKFTSDTAIIQNSIGRAPLGGSTALIDTIYAALNRMRAARNPRRALVIVSDGMDNHSRHSQQELVRLAVEADVEIYTIAIDAVRRENKTIQELEARRGLSYLEDLAGRTGGLHFVIQNRKEATVAGERIGLAIRNQYVIGYQPHNLDSSGKWHRVQVRLDRAQVQIYARSGYYAR